MAITTMLTPIMIGSMRVKNRFVMPPMGTDNANKDGSISQGFIDYYAERAKGGFGLITIEVTAVDPLGKAIMNEPGLWCDEQIEGYKKVVDECHKYGAKVSVQLHHSGRETCPAYIGAQPVGITSEPCPMYREPIKELSTEELYALIEKFGDAALRAYKAGADAVEVHGAHSYLIAQLTSQESNHRIDEFGGSFENRMRFSKKVVENIRSKAGNDFPILYRLSGEERVGGGNTLYDTRAMARYLEEAGVNAIHVTCGRPDLSSRWVLPPSSERTGYSLHVAEEIKKAVSIPVISVGRHTEPYIAEDAVSTGKVDLVSFGRQSMADPYLPNKAAGNKLEELIPCIACNQGCVGRLLKNENAHCLANPFTGREGETRIVHTVKPKKIMVVGGGPAGLVAAWICAQRGHDVTCYEKSAKLGGQFRIAAHPPGKGNISNLIRTYFVIGKNNGAKYVLSTEVTEELINEQKPDVVIIASGSTPLHPNIPGIETTGAVDAIAALDGKVQVGQNVLVVGGGMVGAETSDYYGENLRNVTIIEMLDSIAADEELTPKMYLMERLNKYGTTMITGAKVARFVEGGVVYAKDGVETTLANFDTVILAMGTRAYNPLEKLISGKVPEVHVIGDAKLAKNALNATSEAADVALKI